MDTFAPIFSHRKVGAHKSSWTKVNTLLAHLSPINYSSNSCWTKYWYYFSRFTCFQIILWKPKSLNNIRKTKMLSWKLQRNTPKNTPKIKFFSLYKINSSVHLFSSLSPNHDIVVVIRLVLNYLFITFELFVVASLFSSKTEF